MKILYFVWALATQIAHRLADQIRKASLCFCLTLVGAMLAFPSHAEITYRYIGTPFEPLTIRDENPPAGTYLDCGDGIPCKVTGTFTISELPDVWLREYDISHLVTEFEFSDGRNTLQYPHDPLHFNVRIVEFSITNDPNDHQSIIGWVIDIKQDEYTATRYEDPSGPENQRHHIGTKYYEDDFGWWRHEDKGMTIECTGPWHPYPDDPDRWDCGIHSPDWGRSRNNVGSMTMINGDFPPTADAGSDQNIRYLGQLMELDGTASDDDNTPRELLLYQWLFESRPESSTATLTASETSTPSFTADVSGTYIISLQVTDNAGQSDTDSVEVSTDNLAPTADAGDYAPEFVGHSVSLNGSASSDPENYPLTYEWTMPNKPEGSIAALTLYDTATPWFTPDIEGLYTVELIVRDDLGPSLPDSVEITAVLPETFAEEEVLATAEFVDDLSNALVTTKGNKQALLNFLSQALIAIQIGDTEEAIKKLEDAISRTDGCHLRGGPDGNGKGRDWITDCEAQFGIYGPLYEALNAINP